MSQGLERLYSPKIFEADFGLFRVVPFGYFLTGVVF